MNYAVMMDNEVVLEKQLEQLRARHRELDDLIDGIESKGASPFDLDLRRLKKERLSVRDKIAEIEEILYPDLIA